MKSCYECEECIYIGEGDSICFKTQKSNPVVVLDDWSPTEHFGQCNNKEK